MACGLALLASGQAFAANYASSANIVAADLTSPTNWKDSNCAGMASTTISIMNEDAVTICPTHTLNLSTNDTLDAYMLVFNTGSWAGSGLKFGPVGTGFDKMIMNQSGSAMTITSLDLSAMDIGNKITITEQAFSGLGKTVTFTNVVGKSLSCTPSGGSAAAYSPGTPIAVGTICAVVAAAVNNSVSAPIFSTKEKPAVFSEEVK
jgi:hypothetical protein